MMNSPILQRFPKHIMLLSLLFVAVLPAGGRKEDGQRDRDIARWERILGEPKPAEDRLAQRDALAKRQAEAAFALLRMGQPKLVWPLLRHSPDPSLRSYLIRDLGRSGVSPDILIRHLAVESEASARRALILSLGGFSGEQLPRTKLNIYIRCSPSNHSSS